MKHIVKIDRANMIDSTAWTILLRQLDPSANPLLIDRVEITVDTVFFEE